MTRHAVMPRPMDRSGRWGEGLEPRAADHVGDADVRGWGDPTGRLEELERAYISALLALTDAADARTEYRPGHARRSGELAAQVARVLGLPADQIETVRYGALLHDIGQISVPEEVLRSPCPLTGEEWRMIRAHPLSGAQMLAVVPRLADIAAIVRAHHERWDGRGYPLGLRGEAIPLGARIVAVVDAYLAMIEDRPYRYARSPQEAMAEVERRAGTQFDPTVVPALVQVVRAADKGDGDATADPGDLTTAAVPTASHVVPQRDVPAGPDGIWQPLRESLTRLVRSSGHLRDDAR